MASSASLDKPTGRRTKPALTRSNAVAPVTVTVSKGHNGAVEIAFAGRLEAANAGPAWQAATDALKTEPRHLTLKVGALAYCDGVGAALLLHLKHAQEKRQARFDLVDVDPSIAGILDLYERAAANTAAPPRAARRKRWLERLGSSARDCTEHVGGVVAFVGEAVLVAVRTIAWPGRFRWADTFIIAERAGLQAVPIIGLLGFLIGLIMAFQSAIPLKRFGADLFVANLVALSMLRELGPLMTGVIMAGRSGSAFAAEIGTMKVKEEVDALTTMGLDPMGFLVAPRLTAALVVAPLLTVFMDLASLLGSGVVMATFGYPPMTYIRQVIGAVNYGDFLGGLGKSMVFGVLIAGVGCLNGLNTGKGASAVGISTTRAVVAGLIAIILADGVFALVFYALGW